MVDISRESAEQVDTRLRQVIRQSRLHVYETPYAFSEFPLEAFPAAVDPEALALVRDDQLWSQLVPCADSAAERFMVFRFHFPAGVDNSGFVGWLASHLKAQFGTGVFVTCGQNHHDGGIYDYWGVPLALASEVRRELALLQRQGS